MTIANRYRSVSRDFRVLFSSGAIGTLTDGQLVELYVSRREEVVFEAIVSRHGPMVWGVCRRVLRDHHDAEDAFQATFLVLARKADSVDPKEKVGHWLYGVAYQTARKARAAAFKRRGRERQVPDLPEPESAREDARENLLPLLDREIRRLPEKYRVPIILCDLQGKTHQQASEQLGWPVGTVSGRLSRAKALLARRMAPRGREPSGASLAVLFSRDSASAVVPPSLIASTSKAATAFAAGRAVADVVVSAKVAALTQGVLNSMLTTKIKFAMAMLTAVVALGAAGTAAIGQGRPAEASHPSEGPGPQAKVAPGGKEGLDPKEEMSKLEGTWAVTDILEGGARPTDQQKSAGLGRVVIKGDKFTMKTTVGGSHSTNFAFAIDPSKSPKLISLFLLNDKMEEEENVAIRLGIYELKGDTLTICAGVDRPDKFEAGSGIDRSLLVLKWAR